MKKILVLGAGAMGSAFTVPCIDNNNEVVLVGTHLENDLIEKLKKDHFHPVIKTKLPKELKFEKFENLYVRIDILERLFIQIINSNQNNKNDVMLKPEMLNLIYDYYEDKIVLLTYCQSMDGKYLIHYNAGEACTKK